MLSVKGVIVFNLVTIVITSPVLNTFQENVIQDNEIVTALDKDLLRSKKSLEGKEIKSELIEGKVLHEEKGIVHDVSNKYGNKLYKQNEKITKNVSDVKKFDNLEFKPSNSGRKNENNEDKVEGVDTRIFNTQDAVVTNIDQNKNEMKSIIEQQTNGIDTLIEETNLLTEEDLQRKSRQFTETYPQMDINNGVINPLTPVKMDTRFGPLNDDGFNYIQLNPEEISSYMRQGVTIKNDLGNKITGQEYSSVAGPPQTRHPAVAVPIPVYQYGTPHQNWQSCQNQQHPVVVIQPIVIPAYKEEDKKCPTLTLPIIKDKHPHIEIPHITIPKPTKLDHHKGVANTPLIPSLLTTILPALFPLLTKKKHEHKEKPVVYLSKQFLINPNVVPSITLPTIKPHPKQLSDVNTPSLEKTAFEEVQSFLDNLTENNKTMSNEYLKSAIEKEEIRLANLQNGNEDPVVGSSIAQVPSELRGRLLKRVAELDAEVGAVTEQLSQLQKQQQVAHAIAATID